MVFLVKAYFPGHNTICSKLLGVSAAAMTATIALYLLMKLKLFRVYEIDFSLE